MRTGRAPLHVQRFIFRSTMIENEPRWYRIYGEIEKSHYGHHEMLPERGAPRHRMSRTIESRDAMKLA